MTTGEDAAPGLPPPLSVWKAEGGGLPEWLGKPHSARNDSIPLVPSFVAQMDSAVRRDRIQQTLFNRQPLRRLLRRREWVSGWLTEHGWPTTTVLAGPFSLQDVALHLQGLERGVIKPVHATNAWGVVPFIRSGPVEIRSLFDGRSYRVSALLELLHAPMQRFMFPNKWQIEDLITAPSGEGVPDDFKAYAFRGHVALFLQIHRGVDGVVHKFYDAEWSPVDTGKYPDSTDMNLSPPADPGAMTALAQAISAALPLPFCRIDLYEAAAGPVVGELTPEPGGYQNFDALTDLYLGLCYEFGMSDAENAAGAKENPSAA